MNLFDNLKLRTKLLGAFLILIGLLLATSATALVSQKSVTDSMDHLLDVDVRIAEIVARTDEAMLMARRGEKDYLLRYKNLGLEEARTTYVTQVEESVASIHAHMAEIRSLITQPEQVSATEAVDTATATYESTFLQVVDQMEHKGYVDTGLEGQFREKVHEIEAAVGENHSDQLMITMLMLRRHEKDYLLRGQEKYVTSLHDTVTQFKSQVAETDLDTAAEAQLLSLADEYQTLFDQLVATDTEIAASTETYRAAIHELEPLLEQIHEYAKTGQSATRAAVDQQAQTMTWTILGVSLLATLVGLGLALFLASRITRTVTAILRAAMGIEQDDLAGLAAAVSAMADGDLTVDVKIQTPLLAHESSDEMGELAHAFNNMIGRLQEIGTAYSKMSANLRAAMGEVHDNADRLVETSGQFSAASEQSSEAIQQIAQTIGQVATGTVQQAERVQRARHIVAEQSQAIRGIASGAQRQAQAVENAQHMLSQQLESAIRQVDASATQSAHSAQQAQSVAKTGGDTVRKTVQGMQAIAKATEQVSQRIAEMGQRSSEIGMIVQTIDNIAERTNLLALNAAIEAARAGEHGRGFAVVADEVRKLAEQSARSAQEITQLIKAVQNTAQQARTAMEQGGQDVVQGVALAIEAEEGLNQIQGVVGDVSTQMASLSKAVSQMGSSRDALLETMEQVAAIVEENTASAEQLTVTSEQVLLEMEDVAAISEENSAAAEEVSAGAEEVSAQVEQTVTAASSLADMAESLQQIVIRFKVDASVASPTRKKEKVIQMQPAQSHWNAAQPAAPQVPAFEKITVPASNGHSSQPAKIAAAPVPQTSRPKRFAWDESMRTGDEKVDAQHRELIRQLNELLEMMAQGKGRNHLDRVLDDLEAYTQTHFSWEEGCMAEHHCPMAQANKEAHANFVRMVFETRRRLEREGTSAELVLSVQKNLGDWLVNHICHVDTSLRACVEGGKQSSREPQVFRSRKERDPVQGFEKIVVPATKGHHAH